MQKAIQSPEALNVHASMLEEVAEFIGNREFLKSPNWDGDSDRLCIMLRALKPIRKQGADNPLDLAAIHALSGLDEEDINVPRLVAVRTMIPELVSMDQKKFVGLDLSSGVVDSMTGSQLREIADLYNILADTLERGDPGSKVAKQ